MLPLEGGGVSIGGYCCYHQCITVLQGVDERATICEQAQPRPLNDAAGTIGRTEPIRLPSRIPQTQNWSGAVPINGPVPLGHPRYTGIVAGMPDTSHCMRHVEACPMGHACQRDNGG
jgi:hypothetical protein